MLKKHRKLEFQNIVSRGMKQGGEIPAISGWGCIEMGPGEIRASAVP